MNNEVIVFKNIASLLQGLKTLKPKHEYFHIHRFEDTPDTQVNETAIFRSNAYVMILLLEGQADYKIGLHEYHMGPGSLYFLGPRHLRHYSREENNWKGFACLFTDEFTTSTNLPNHFADYPFYSLKGNQKLQLNNAEIDVFQDKINELYQAFDSGKLDNCWHLLHIILGDAKDVYYQKFKEEEHEPEAELVIQFNGELENHFFNIASGKAENIYSVNDFAERLFVHPNHLSSTLKKHTGRTASQIIKDRTIIEAKSLLQSTDMSVSQVAYTLRFNDTSYFTKYFKKSVGMTPVQFQGG